MVSSISPSIFYSSVIIEVSGFNGVVERYEVGNETGKLENNPEVGHVKDHEKENLTYTEAQR